MTTYSELVPNEDTVGILFGVSSLAAQLVKEASASAVIRDMRTQVIGVILDMTSTALCHVTASVRSSGYLGMKEDQWWCLDLAVVPDLAL